MRLRSISRYICAPLSAVFFLAIAVSAHAHQPGLVRLDQQGAKALKGGGGMTPATPPAYREGEVLVKMKERAAKKTEKELASELGAEKARKLHSDKTVPGLYKLKLKAGDTVEKKIKELKSHPDVEYVQPNYIYHAEAAPGDTLFKQQWEMYNTGQSVEGVVGKAGADMKMPAAWGISTGSKDVVVAVIDTGIDYYSPDFFGKNPDGSLNLSDSNIWTNPHPGSYDPVNYPDDVHGINPLALDPPPHLDENNNPIPWPYTSSDSGNPYDDFGHGTHVSGTVGAKGNNAAGVAGINWNTSIMALKGLDYNGYGSDSDLIECINYAVFQKRQYDSNHNDGANVRVINASWGGSPGSSTDQALYDAIQTAGNEDILFVAAAGNDGTNNDTTLIYPASWAGDSAYNSATYPALPNIIAVAATDNKDNMASFSNYGSSVAVAAPGVDILSSLPVGERIYFDNFEHGMAWNGIHWVPGSFPDGVNNTWGLTTESYLSATHSLTDSPGALYKANTDNWAIWGPLDLSTQTGPLRLEYLLKLDTELYYDGVLVDYTPDGGTNWYTPDGFTGKTPGYEYLFTDISPMAGSSSNYIAFELVTNSSVNKDGVHIDDVSVTKRPTTVQPTGSYWYESGTSMAAPHVTGLAALMLAANPDLTASQVKDRIISSVDPLPGLQPPNIMTVSSGGRVNGMKALAAAVGDGLRLMVSQSGGYTVMTATFIYAGSLQYGKYIRFYQDGVLIGTVLTGAYTSATPGIATLKVSGKAGDHTAYAISVAATGVPAQTSSTESYHTYPPTIDAVSPSNATIGSAVTLTGSFFCPTKGTVYMTNVTGSPVATAVVPLTWSDNGSTGGASLTFTVPARVAGTYALTVKNFAMTGGPASFTIPPPAITGLDLPSAAPGVTVTINGTDFGLATGSLSLKSSTGVVTSVVPITGSWKDTSIKFKVPGIKADSYQLTVKNAAATSAPVAITIPSPAISGLVPASAAAGVTVTINGTGFGLTTGSLSLKSSTGVVTSVAPIAGNWTDTSIKFKVPGIKSDSYQLTVKNAAATSASQTFIIPPPAISGLDQATAAPGVTVSINGAFFGLTKGSLSLKSSTNVVTAVVPVIWTDNSITFKVPSIKTDSYQLTVKNAAATSTPQAFTIPPPAISGLVPPSAAVGMEVGINGSGFGKVTGAISMKAGATVTAVTPKVWDDSKVTFLAPPKPMGTYSITVKNAAGTSASSPFNVPRPAVTSLSPDTAGPGIPVTITGTALGMTKGSVLLTTASGTITTTTITPTVWVDTSITFTVPGMAAKTYNLAVKNAAGTSATTAFTIPLPAPANVSPASAKAGTTGIIITGSYFGATKGSVLVTNTSGTIATTTVTPTAWGDTSITFTVPARTAGAYKISVKDIAGTSSPALDFTISP
jgi:subtilisin family serine protease